MLPLAITMFFACSNGALHPLETTPIKGADDSEEAVIHAEIARIIVSMQVEDLRFEAIVLAGSTAEDHLGGYDDARSRIELPRALSKDDTTLLQHALVHQVCHAMDAQLGDLSAHKSGALVSVYRDLVDDDHTYPDRADQHSEGFAQLCALGPGPLEALADPDEPTSSSTEVAGWMLDIATLPVESPTLDTWLHAEPIDVDFPDFAVYDDGVLRIPVDEDMFRYVDGEGRDVDGPSERAESAHLPLDYDAFEARPFRGGVLSSADAASGAAVVFAEPIGGSRNHAFVRGANGVWTWAGPITNPFLLSKVGGDLVFATEPEPGVFQVDRLP